MKKKYEAPRSKAIELSQNICLGIGSGDANSSDAGSRKERHSWDDDDW